jgi:hypothetical protein
MRCSHAVARLSSVLALALLLSGCSKTDFGSRPETAYIREEATGPQLATKPGALWPFSAGKRWETVTRQAGSDGVGSVIVDEGVKTLSDGRDGEAIFSYRNGKLYRVEYYRTDPAGDLDLLALGNSVSNLIEFTPAIPIIRSPIDAGQALSWSGVARYAGGKLYATAFHRIGEVEPVKTPFETVNALRLDGIVSILGPRTQFRLPVAMWFLPGKGPARRRLASHGHIDIEVITRFSPTEK